MLLHDNRISMRIQKQILKNAKHRTQQLIKERKTPISLSAYLRELIKLDVDKKQVSDSCKNLFEGIA